MAEPDMPHQDPLAQQLAAADRLHHITQRAGLALVEQLAQQQLREWWGDEV